MTYEEASALAKAILEGAPKLSRKNGKNSFDWMMFEFYSTAIEALDKRTPMKPSKTDAYPHRLYCTNCGWTFFYNENNKTEGMFNYCPECGQAIDWGEVE